MNNLITEITQNAIFVLELHQISHQKWVADYTAGRELRPAPKNYYILLWYYNALKWYMQYLSRKNKLWLPTAYSYISISYIQLELSALTLYSGRALSVL